MSQGSPEGGTEQGWTKHAWPFGSPVISTLSQVRMRNIQDVLLPSRANALGATALVLCPIRSCRS
jgi:hypothetical protein